MLSKNVDSKNSIEKKSSELLNMWLSSHPLLTYMWTQHLVYLVILDVSLSPENQNNNALKVAMQTKNKMTKNMILNRATSQLLKTVNFKLGSALLSTAMLIACGGGDSTSTSSSTSSSSSSLTLNLNAAYEKHTIGGSSVTGTISGYCQGTRVFTLSPTYSGTTLDGKSALLFNEYELDTMAANSNEFCKSFYGSNNISQVKYTGYYDPKTLVPISSGSNPPTTVYQNQLPFPTSVSDGSSGKWFNTISFEKGIPVATGIQTWEVQADTPTTLLFITNNKAYTSIGDQLLFNQTTWYRLNADNTLTPLRKNIQPTALLTGNGDQNIDEVYQQK